MPINLPTSVLDGDSTTITGTALSLVDPVELVASNGAQEFVIAQVVTGPRDATSIPIDVDSGLASKIAGDLTAFAGVPLTDSNWSLKWRVGADELGVVVSPPANIQQREIAESEKFGGWLSDIPFGEQDQQFGEIVTSTNTVKHTESNGKGTGYLDGIERTMAEIITNYFYTSGDGKWRARDINVVPFGNGQIVANWTIGTNGGSLRGYRTGEFGGLDPNPWNDGESLFQLSVNVTNDLIVIQGSDTQKIFGSNTMQLHVKGSGETLLLTWNGSTRYQGTSASLNTFIQANEGNSVPVLMTYKPEAGEEFTSEFTTEFS